MIPTAAQALKQSMLGQAASDHPLQRALELYNDVETLVSGVIDAEPEQRLRLAARVINLCHELDVALDQAGVAPMADRGLR